MIIAKTDERHSPKGCQVNAFNFILWAITLSKYVSMNNRIKKFDNVEFFS